jgi:hypothetical protein
LGRGEGENQQAQRKKELHGVREIGGDPGTQDEEHPGVYSWDTLVRELRVY